MKIFVNVKPNSKLDSVTKTGENEFILRTKAPAKEGRANEAVIKLLSSHFNIPKSKVIILKGHTSKTKVINLA